jgi:hypothetical protein
MTLPFSADSGDVLINNNSAWHMHTNLTLNNDGTIRGSVRSWTTNGSDAFGSGFHAAVVVTFSDNNGKIIYQWSNVYGVSGGFDFTGPHDRTDPIIASMPAAEAATVAGIAIVQTYDPQNNFLNGINHFLQQVSQDFQQFTQFCTTVYQAIISFWQIVSKILGGGGTGTGTSTGTAITTPSDGNAATEEQGLSATPARPSPAIPQLQRIGSQPVVNATR